MSKKSQRKKRRIAAVRRRKTATKRGNALWDRIMGRAAVMFNAQHFTEKSPEVVDEEFWLKPRSE